MEVTISSVGCMGVIYSIYIEVIDACFLSEQRYMISYQQFKESEYKSIINNKNIESHQQWLLPYKRRFKLLKRDYPVIITTYQKSNKIPPKKIPYSIIPPNNILRASNSSAIIIAALICHLSQTMPWLCKILLSSGVDGVCHDKPIIMPYCEAILFGNGNAVPNQTSGIGVEY